MTLISFLSPSKKYPEIIFWGESTHLKVEEICTKTLITVNQTTKASIAAKLMLKHGIGSLIVVSQNQPIGIITRGDLITRVIGKDNNRSLELESIMSKTLLLIEETGEVLDAAKIMAENNVKHLLVTKSVLTQKISRIASLDLIEKKPESTIKISQPMVGIISASDVLKRIDLLAAEKEFDDHIST